MIKTQEIGENTDTTPQPKDKRQNREAEERASQDICSCLGTQKNFLGEHNLNRSHALLDAPEWPKYIVYINSELTFLFSLVFYCRIVLIRTSEVRKPNISAEVACVDEHL